MAEESLHSGSLERSIDFHIVTLFERLEALRCESHENGFSNNFFFNNKSLKRNINAEVRTMEFWRSIISECLASFFYVFIVCGAAAGSGVGASVSSVLLATALASGLTMATLTQCFLNTSGSHINPAVTVASCVIRAISPIRAAMYVTAQCGGAIAGAALLYSVTGPGYQSNLQAAISHNSSLANWERFGVEFVLTFIVVLSYFISTDSLKKFVGTSTILIGVSYSACSFVSMPYLNPARSLGPSFVLSKWDNHWVYWVGPLAGGVCSGIIYEYVFNVKRIMRLRKTSNNNDLISVRSENDLNYNFNIEKQISNRQHHGIESQISHQPITTQTNNRASAGNFSQNLYTTPPPLEKFDQPEAIYGGTRSMYSRSPTLTRTNLSRSQSVYTKSNNRDTIPRSGPLVAAQSIYSNRVQQTQQAQTSHLQNQNVHNQQRSEGANNGLSLNGGSLHQPQGEILYRQTQMQKFNHKHQNQNERQQHNQLHIQQPQVSQFIINSDQQICQPIYGSNNNPKLNESIFAQRCRGQSAKSDDSSYGSFHGSSITPPVRNAKGDHILPFSSSPHTEQGIACDRTVSTPVVQTQSQRNQTITPKLVVSKISSGSSSKPLIAHQRQNLHQYQSMSNQQQQNYGILPSPN